MGALLTRLFGWRRGGEGRGDDCSSADDSDVSASSEDGLIPREQVLLTNAHGVGKDSVAQVQKLPTDLVLR